MTEAYVLQRTNLIKVCIKIYSLQCLLMFIDYSVFIDKCICVINKVVHFWEFCDVKISHVLEIKKFNMSKLSHIN